ncbi:hypothetical protein J5N97_028314 [Dioscorea zingiberensis]|uniref:Uncharacterized protein n=1 Tax=Dioscorea zingiberensis TaxID=325984 RepID=A0A9D5BZ92_9LILI|nr:hypothetical protein J5N97_028314 [Dioscorea zingiberensis]
MYLELEEEDEEEDVDFNPFLREESPSEASSSLSSDNEAPVDNARKLIPISVDHQDASATSIPTDGMQIYNRGSGNEDDEVVLQARIPLEVANGDVQVQSSQEENGLTCSKGGHMPFEHGIDAPGKIVEEISGQTCNPKDSLNQVIDIDNEEAICRRTRARHSLANHTLEELEAFLQESDDDGDFQNVDDEEEYRKFLAAVLLGGTENGLEGQEDENIDEDEEENDADFELEIEEALESDVDECINNDKRWNKKKEGDPHRPETRQKKRLEESDKNKKSLLGLAKTPLRPLLPYVPNTQISPYPPLGWQFSLGTFSQCSSSFSGADLINGFTAQQIGQLYTSIYEHAQLLIQTFSISVLDPSRQEVASDVKNMILEIVDRREEALTLRKMPYPSHCFHPLHPHTSLILNGNQTTPYSDWVPSIDIPVLSVLDVAPLRLAKSYLTDVSATVLRYRQLHVEDVADKSHFTKEPLFQLHLVEPSGERNDVVMEETAMMSSSTVSSQSSGLPQPKKSLAAILVESTMKESVALVPKDIAKLTKRFYPLFNSALFPHKPPLQAVASRVLFTDAEDRLLATGIMNYNNDWAAIRQHYLPCKTEHQIFVRQKNRSSSKAQENPIKAVRRMKASPLTPDEQARIYEGLKVFKHDWLSVWKFFVPHRDPSLLQRQWRTATGTQKSYKKCEALKLKRRLYEAKRRERKASLGDCQLSSRKEVDNGGDNSADAIDDEDEAYVHEAFLAETQPGSYNSMPSDERSELPMQSGATNECVASSMTPNNFSHSSDHRCGMSQTALLSKQLPSKFLPRPSTKQLISLTCQTHKSKGVRLVKLAPDLPPVNLPPSGRVISQSAFKSYHCISAYSNIGNSTPKNVVSCLPQVAKVGPTALNPEKNKTNFSDNGSLVSCRQDGSTHADQFVAEENTSESDLHMHPLLFQASENQLSSYYPVNCSGTASNTYNFFPPNSIQFDTNLLKRQRFHRPVDEVPSSLSTIDFHRLLQRTENLNDDAAIQSSGGQLSGNLQSVQDNHDHVVGPSNCNFRQGMVDEDDMAMSTKSPNQHEKETDIDLDIRLSSSKDAESTKGSKYRNEEISGSNRPTMERGIAENSLHTGFLCDNLRDNNAERLFPADSSLQSSDCAMNDVNSSKVGLASNVDACQRAEGSHFEESIPDIIMEQEELSDSDEESEHVHFECEEMDDSEGERLDQEPTFEVQNKEFPTFTADQDTRTVHDLNLPPHQLASLTQVSVGNNNKRNGGDCIDPFSSSASSSKSKPKRQKIMHPIYQHPENLGGSLFPSRHSIMAPMAKKQKLMPLKSIIKQSFAQSFNEEKEGTTTEGEGDNPDSRENSE